MANPEVINSKGEALKDASIVTCPQERVHPLS